MHKNKTEFVIVCACVCIILSLVPRPFWESFNTCVVMAARRCIVWYTLLSSDLSRSSIAGHYRVNADVHEHLPCVFLLGSISRITCTWRTCTSLPCDGNESVCMCVCVCVCVCVRVCVCVYV